jgi:hypothetical protein
MAQTTPTAPSAIMPDGNDVANYELFRARFSIETPVITPAATT